MVGGSRSLLVTALLAPGVLAASLADFTPRATNLPTTCQVVYSQTIAGCTDNDFRSRVCSATCIASINALKPLVNTACAGVTGQNIIVAFLAGQGVQQLCPNAGTSSTTTQQTTTTQPPTTTVAPSTTTPVPTTTSRVETTTTNPPASSSSNIATSTSAPDSRSVSPSRGSSTTFSRTSTSTDDPATTTSSLDTSIVMDTSTPTDSPPESTTASTTRSQGSQTGSSNINQGGSPFGSQPGLNAGAALTVASSALLAAMGLTLPVVLGLVGRL